MISHYTEIDFSKTGILPALVNDYISGKDAISFLTKYPFKLSSFESVINDKIKDGTNRKLLVDVLQSQYSDIPASQLVTDNIQSLLSLKTFTVTAAHQPCLFMGPVYNIYKIACTINLTNQLNQQFANHHFVPMFWLGSEDHDVEELNHAFVNGNKIEWNESGRGAAGRWKTATMQKVISDLKRLIGNTELVILLEDGMKKYDTFGKFTQYFVNEIFKGHGLVVINQDDVRLKRSFAEVINDEILNSRAAQVLKENIEFLETNYKTQAKPREINFFYLGENYRERIVLNPVTQRFEVNNASISFSKDELIAEVENHPERFSPNVIMRPLYQEMILPNLAFVGGAGELSYWLELKPLFNYYKVNYPMQVLRNSAVILNPATQKKIEKLNLKPDDFFGDVEQLINSFVKHQMTSSTDLSSEKSQLKELYDLIAAKAETTDITLKQSAGTEKQKVLTALENLEAKMLKAEKRKHETAVNQIRSIHDTFFPENVLQERRENFIPYYSKDFISEMVSSLDGFSKSLRIFLTAA